VCFNWTARITLNIKPYLGKWKHEATIKETLYCTKSYAYIDVDGKKNVESKGALNAYLDMTFIRQNYWKQNLVNVSQRFYFQ
jgi:hypothetical protein